MRETCVELSVGDSVHFDDQVLTVMDIHGDEVTFRVDRCDDHNSTPQTPFGEEFATRPPR
jgi:hypothetical protein